MKKEGEQLMKAVKVKISYEGLPGENTCSYTALMPYCIASNLIKMGMSWEDHEAFSYNEIKHFQETSKILNPA